MELLADGEGRWTINGESIPGVNGAIDIDLGFSPATNLLPNRRLDLEVGERAELGAIWVRFPGLRVERLDQAYQRDAARVFRYEALVDGTSFQARLDIDEFGRVQTI